MRGLFLVPTLSVSGRKIQVSILLRCCHIKAKSFKRRLNQDINARTKGSPAVASLLTPSGKTYLKLTSVGVVRYLSKATPPHALLRVTDFICEEIFRENLADS